MITKKKWLSLILSVLLIAVLYYQISRQSKESPKNSLLNPMGSAENIGETPPPQKSPSF